MSKRPNGRLKSTSAQIGHLTGRFDRFRNTESRKAPPKIQNLRRPESATYPGVSIDSEHQGSTMPNEGLQSAWPLNRSLRCAFRSIRKHRGSMMPDAGLKYTSPRIGHFRGRFGRFRNTKGRRRPTKSLNIRRSESAFPRLSPSIWRHRGSKMPQHRAAIYVAPDRPV